MPGPGSYTKFSTLNIKKKQPKYQFFDSTEDRFKGSLFGEGGEAASKVGPGSYDQKGLFDS
jgi:hypothetical protein